MTLQRPQNLQFLKNERNEIEGLHSDNITEEMLTIIHKWNKVKSIIMKIIETKERESIEEEKIRTPNHSMS